MTRMSVRLSWLQIHIKTASVPPRNGSYQDAVNKVHYAAKALTGFLESVLMMLKHMTAEPASFGPISIRDRTYGGVVPSVPPSSRVESPVSPGFSTGSHGDSDSDGAKADRPLVAIPAVRCIVG
jgi:hypothetical protein